MKKKLEKNIGYFFDDKKLLKKALTHSSYAHENESEDNERLEFLGDAVLELIVSNYIFNEYHSLKEGGLTKMRASLVCQESLASMARKVNLGKFIFLGKGEAKNKGYRRDSILSDCFEGLIGAVYLDSNYKTAEKVFLKIIKEFEKTNPRNTLYVDYKTYLQEKLQQINNQDILYKLVKQKGPDHDKIFYVEVYHGNKFIGKGKGKNKKEAEQEAAKSAIEKIEGNR